MKKMFIFAVMCGLLCSARANAGGVGGMSLPDLGAVAQKATVNPTVQVGFQRVGSNMELPIQFEGPIAGLLQIDGLNITLQEANFWTGSATLTAKAGELLSLFASMGGSLNRHFVVSGEIPIGLGPVGVLPTIDFTASKLSMWYAQGGVGLGPVLLGLYGDHFAITVGDPRRGSVPLDNQTLRGDVMSTTLAPYIGFAIPAAGALFTVMYSPLATSNTTLVLRTSDQDLAQVQYKWNKPGNFVSSSFQYNMAPVCAVALGVWANYTWMDVRGNAQLDFQDSTLAISRQKEVTAIMTKYVLQGGCTLGITF